MPCSERRAANIVETMYHTVSLPIPCDAYRDDAIHRLYTAGTTTHKHIRRPRDRMSCLLAGINGEGERCITQPFPLCQLMKYYALLCKFAVRTEHIHNLVDIHLLHILTCRLEILARIEVSRVLCKVLADGCCHCKT